MTDKIERLPVAGYRPQTASAITLVNSNKQLEEAMLRQLDYMAKLDGIDQRWLAIGRTDLEKAFMSINRAVFRPARVRLPGDLDDEPKANSET